MHDERHLHDVQFFLNKRDGGYGGILVPYGLAFRDFDCWGFCSGMHDSLSFPHLSIVSVSVSVGGVGFPFPPEVYVSSYGGSCPGVRDVAGDGGFQKLLGGRNLKLTDQCSDAMSSRDPALLDYTGMDYEDILSLLPQRSKRRLSSRKGRRHGVRATAPFKTLFELGRHQALPKKLDQLKLLPKHLIMDKLELLLKDIRPNTHCSSKFYPVHWKEFLGPLVYTKARDQALSLIKSVTEGYTTDFFQVPPRNPVPSTSPNKPMEQLRLVGSLLKHQQLRH